MSDLDPIITTAKAATSSIKSAIQSGREISSAVESIQNFGMAEVKARHAFKTVRSSQEGEITIMTAMSEWRRLDQIRRMELEVRDFLVKQFGEEKGLEEFEKIKKIKEDMISSCISPVLMIFSLRFSTVYPKNGIACGEKGACIYR